MSFSKSYTSGLLSGVNAGLFVLGFSQGMNKFVMAFNVTAAVVTGLGAITFAAEGIANRIAPERPAVPAVDAEPSRDPS